MILFVLDHNEKRFADIEAWEVSRVRELAGFDIADRKGLATKRWTSFWNTHGGLGLIPARSARSYRIRFIERLHGRRWLTC